MRSQEIEVFTNKPTCGLMALENFLPEAERRVGPLSALSVDY